MRLCVFSKTPKQNGVSSPPTYERCLPPHSRWEKRVFPLSDQFSAGALTSIVMALFVCQIHFRAVCSCGEAGMQSAPPPRSWKEDVWCQQRRADPLAVCYISGSSDAFSPIFFFFFFRRLSVDARSETSGGEIKGSTRGKMPEMAETWPLNLNGWDGSKLLLPLSSAVLFASSPVASVLVLKSQVCVSSLHVLVDSLVLDLDSQTCIQLGLFTVLFCSNSSENSKLQGHSMNIYFCLCFFSCFFFFFCCFFKLPVAKS